MEGNCLIILIIKIVESHRHLVLYENRFGKCVGGTHPDVQEDTQRMV